VVVVRATIIPLVVDGAVTAVYAGCRDVTATHAAAGELAEREALYSLLVEQSPECVCIFQDERCVYVNAAGAGMRGTDVTPGDVEGANWVHYVHPDDSAHVEAEYRALLAAPPGTSRPIENRFLSTEGRLVEVEGVITSVAYRGRPAGAQLRARRDRAAAAPRPRCGARSGSRRSAAWRRAWRTTSTTCSR
jgi:PAS domain S-box-containing protein